MPATLTYPGVYIEEIPSGVHTITGVATSITAFVGWAPQGPVSEATLVESWAEYEAIFGGLDSRSNLGYAVNQFFGNGGQQAYIVRLVWDGSLPPAPGTNPSDAATAVAAGLGYGRTQIGAASGSITSAPVALSVGTPVLQSIAITPENLPPIPINATGLTFTATGTNSDGTTPNLTAAATWSSSDTSVIAVGPGGVATPNGPGPAVITATSGLISGSITVTVTAASLTNITVSPAGPLTRDSGQTQQFSATGNYVDGTTQDLTGVVAWSPNADFSQTTATSPAIPGLFVQTIVGPYSVTAAWAGVSSAVTNVTVAVAAPVSLIVTRVAATMTKGTTQAFNADLVNSDGTTTDVSATATWASSNAAVATFGGGNTLSAVDVGTATLTATSGAFSAITTVTVTAATLQSITVTPAAPTIGIGQSLQLKAVGVYNDGTTADLSGCSDWTPPGGGEVQVSQQTVTVTNGVVTLSNGSITGVSVTGAPVTVTASFGGKSGTAAVSVTAAVLTSITVAPATTPPTILSGQTLQFNATGHLSDGSTLTPVPGLTWASSNTSVATINASGLALGVGSGGSLTLFANNPGAWGNNLRVTVTVPNPNPNGKFSLLVQEVDPMTGVTSTLESFSNLSVSPTDPQYAVTVVDNDSNYITFLAPGATPPPPPPSGPPSAAGPIALSGGADGAVLVPASDQNFELVMLNDPLGVYLLRRVDIFNLLCVPGETDAPSIQELQLFCFDERASYIVDPPQTANHASLQKSGPAGSTSGSITGTASQNSAYYFPWVLAPDPLFGNRPTLFPPCGFVAGIYAATDANRGVWKAPAGIAASLTGVSGLQYVLTDEENGDLNTQAINCLRQFQVYGDVVWGARTLQGNDQAGSEWKYLSIRRTALYIESSLLDGTQWVVFEPNDEPLWSQIRLNVGAFMQGLFLQGAFQGTTPQQAYFVKCDSENNPQSSIDQGIVNILVGFAPLYPAEFVVIQIQQMAGQLQT